MTEHDVALNELISVAQELDEDALAVALLLVTRLAGYTEIDDPDTIEDIDQIIADARAAIRRKERN